MPVDKPSAKPIVIAAFDFDGTLTKRDTFMPFLARGLGWPRFLLALALCSPWLAAFALRLIPNHNADRRLDKPLAGPEPPWSIATLDDGAAGRASATRPLLRDGQRIP